MKPRPSGVVPAPRFLGLLLSLAAGLALVRLVRADWTQTVGMGERAALLGGAFTAIADDYSAYFYNPAGIATFRQPVLGLDSRILDTRRFKIADQFGSHDVDRTNNDSPVAIAPSLGVFVPLSWIPGAAQFGYADRVNVGVGMGAPFGLTVDWENDSGVHRFDSTNESLFVFEVVPTIGFQLSDQISIGGGANVVAFKQLRVEPLIGDGFVGEAANFVTGGAVPPNVTIDGVPDGHLRLQTADHQHLGLPPNKFDSDWRTVSYTLGALYRFNDRLRFGVTYRAEMPTQFKGTAQLNLDRSATLGVLPQESKADYSLDFHMPRNLQWGIAYELIPQRLTISLDLLWTNWGAAQGVGSPTRVKLAEPGLLALPTSLAPLLQPANPSAHAAAGEAVDALVVDYKAHDTISVHSGAQYKLIPGLDLLVGYAYDPAFHDSNVTDVLTYSSNRHLASLGIQYELSRLLAGWLGKENVLLLTTGFQAVVYESRVLHQGESSTLGGVAYYQDRDGNFSTLNFVSNSDPFAGFRPGGQPITGQLEIGGFFWAAGLSLECRFASL